MAYSPQRKCHLNSVCFHFIIQETFYANGYIISNIKAIAIKIPIFFSSLKNVSVLFCVVYKLVWHHLFSLRKYMHCFFLLYRFASYWIGPLSWSIAAIRIFVLWQHSERMNRKRRRKTRMISFNFSVSSLPGRWYCYCCHGYAQYRFKSILLCLQADKSKRRLLYTVHRLFL